MTAAQTAGLAASLACGLLVSGVYVLAGLGWALLASAVPLFLLSAVILRGLGRA